MTLGTVPASRHHLDRARDYLAASGVGTLLLLKTENRRYVTGFTGSAGLALISPAEAFLAVDFRYEEQAAAEATACTVLRGGRDPLAALSAAVAGRSLGTIGFESEFVPFAQVTRLREKLAPAELVPRSEEHTSALQSHVNIVCRLPLEKKKTTSTTALVHRTKKKKCRG